MEYIKKIGIESFAHKIKLHFGGSRTNVRKILGFNEKRNIGWSNIEDSYENLLDTGYWIRLTFNKSEKLDEIELLKGKVQFKSKTIEIYGNLSETLNRLTKSGCNFTETDYGYTDFNNLIDIGDAEQSGGLENVISWFYTSLDFGHLKNNNST